MSVSRFFVSLIFAVSVCPRFAAGQIAIYPLRDIRAGQHAIGKTVFQGNKISEFQVEILGVLDNVGPRQSIILARLSGGPLAETGVMQGMSGSPVYIDGRLVGAVALGFNFSKEPIAGIRPIEEMLAVGDPAGKQPAKGPDRPPVRKAASNSDSLASKLIDIATPVSFSGFTAGTLDQFGPELKKLGLEPRQGVSSGGKLPTKLGAPTALRPGDMIAVELLSGDMSIGAEGTVTALDGKRLYAFGHQFMSVGNTQLPFARAEVLALLPNLSSSFKISSPLEWMGTITQDRSTSIYGELGRKADTHSFRHYGEGWTPRAAAVSHADDPGSRALALHRADRRLFGHGRHRAHPGLGQLLAARRRGIRRRRSAPEARQHLRGRLSTCRYRRPRAWPRRWRRFWARASTRSRSRASTWKSRRPNANDFCK